MIELLTDPFVARQKKVGLQSFYSYETGISGCLRHLLEGEQWTIPLDAREVLRAAAVERRRAKMEAGANPTEEEDRHHENGDEKTVKPEPGGRVVTRIITRDANYRLTH